MDNDIAKGKGKKIAGRAQRAIGALTGNKKMEGKGALREAEGSVQSAWGKAKDKVRGARAKRGTVVTTRTTRTTTRIKKR